MKRSLSLGTVLFLLLLLCAAFPLGSGQARADDYVIGDGDALNISVWGAKELGGQVTVRPDGKITLEAVGDVTASGFTPMKLAEELGEKLKSVVKKPIVTVTVTGITNNKVYLIGGGVPSGILNLPDRTTLLKFLCRLGTLKGADLAHAYIYRGGKKLDVNFYDIFVKGELSKDAPLFPGDVLYIPDNESSKIYLMGAVNAPKFIYHREGLRILDAILEAGGFTKFAKENDVLLVRKGSPEVSVKAKDLVRGGDLSQNLALQPGDLLIVKESLF